MAELMGKLSADINVSPTPAQFIRPIELFQLIEPSTAADRVQTALKSFNDYTKIYYAIHLGKIKGDDLRKLIGKYQAVTSACQQSTVAKPAVFTITCKVGSDSNVPFVTYQEAWPSKSNQCSAAIVSGVLSCL